MSHTADPSPVPGPTTPGDPFAVPQAGEPQRGAPPGWSPRPPAAPAWSPGVGAGPDEFGVPVEEPSDRLAVTGIALALLSVLPVFLAAILGPGSPVFGGLGLLAWLASITVGAVACIRSRGRRLAVIALVLALAGAPVLWLAGVVLALVLG